MSSNNRLERSLTFGDNVRVRDAVATRELSLVGVSGQVYGVTTPTLTGVDVIGQPSSDVAINVHFEAFGKSFWFAPELLDLVDHAAGTEIRIKGVPKKWTRTADGSWVEEPVAERAGAARPWWKFW